MRIWGPYVLAATAAALIVLFVLQPWNPAPTPDRGAGDPGIQGPVPPTRAELEKQFSEDRAEFEALRDLITSLPFEAVTLQVNHFALGKRGWSEREPGVWSPRPEPDPEPAEPIDRSLEEVLADVGLTTAQHDRLKAFVRRHRVLGVARWSNHPPGETVAFRPISSMPGEPTQRMIVWHADDEPFEREGQRRLSKTNIVTEYTTEVSLGVPGWFVRTQRYSDPLVETP